MRRPPSGRNDGRLKSLSCGNRATFSFISGSSWLSPAPYTTIARSTGGARAQVGIPRREHPVEHRPRHLRKAGKEVVIADRERGDAVDRIRNDAAACGKLGHQHAVRIRLGAERASISRDRLRMAHERHAERRGRGLPRVVVGRRADAAEAEHEVAARERVAQHRGEALAVVADVVRVVEREPARGERLDHVREVLVLRACPTGSRRR